MMEIANPGSREQHRSADGIYPQVVPDRKAGRLRVFPIGHQPEKSQNKPGGDQAPGDRAIQRIPKKPWANDDHWNEKEVCHTMNGRRYHGLLSAHDMPFRHLL